MARNVESGWEQIYFLGYDGTLRRLTDGENWGIRLIKVDEKKGDVWFTAKRDSRLHTTFYRLDRKGRITALTDPELNVQGARISEDGKTFEAAASTARTPWVSVSGRTDKYAMKIDSTLVEAPGVHPDPQLVKIGNDGFDLYGLMSLPEGFDPSKKYPVQMQLYGGPARPTCATAGRTATLPMRGATRTASSTSSWIPALPGRTAAGAWTRLSAG